MVWNITFQKKFEILAKLYFLSNNVDTRLFICQTKETPAFLSSLLFGSYVYVFR